MEDEELVKLFNPTLKRRETIFFLIVVINVLMWIDSNIGLDKWEVKGWGVKIVLCNFYL